MKVRPIFKKINHFIHILYKRSFFLGKKTERRGKKYTRVIKEETERDIQMKGKEERREGGCKGKISNQSSVV